MASPPGNDGEEHRREQSTGIKRQYQPSDEGSARSSDSSSRYTSSSGQAFNQSDTDAEAPKRPHVSSSSENDVSRTTVSTHASELPSHQSSVSGSSLNYLAQQRPSTFMDDSTRLAVLQQHAERTSESESSSLAQQASLPVQFPAPAAPNMMGRSQYPGNMLPSNFFTSLHNPSEFGAAEAMASTNAFQLGMLQQIMSTQQALAQQGGPSAMMPPQQQYVNPLLAAANPFGGQLLYQQFLNNLAALGDPRMQVVAASMSGLASNATQSFSSVSEAPGTSSALARSISSNSATTSASGNGGQAQEQERRPGGPVLYMPSDDDLLSDHQVLVRKQIEFFEAQVDDVNVVMPGRRKEIVLGQVGIRCRHCAGVPVHQRTKGSVYYPAKLKGLYQAAQNMAGSHLCESCENINPYLKTELRAYHDGKSSSGHGGKQYWADSATVFGVIETEEGLRFDPNKQKGKGGKKHDKA
jgi:hypothetical protein